MKHIHILNIEDSEKDSDLILLALKRAGFDVEWKRVDTPDAVVAELENGEWDLIISDYSMPGYTALEALEVLRTTELDIPFILVSGSADHETAVLAMRRGASDYLMKDDLARLVPAVTRELNEAANRREKREAQKALAESEERLNLALAAAGMGAWEWDLQTDDVFWSPECSTILGIPVAGTQIAQVLSLIVEEDREIADEKIQQAIASGSTLSLQVRINRRGNEIVWIAINGKCESDDKGVFVRMVGTLRDITRDKKAEDALIDAEERYRVVAETASDAIISINEKSRIIFANPAAETIFGYSYAEMIGSELTMLMPDSLKGRHLSGFNRYLQTGKKHLDWHNVEVTARRKDG